MAKLYTNGVKKGILKEPRRNTLILIDMAIELPGARFYFRICLRLCLYSWQIYFTPQKWRCDTTFILRQYLLVPAKTIIYFKRVNVKRSFLRAATNYRPQY